MPIMMPGLASNMDIDGMIKKIMKAKRAPIERLEAEIEGVNTEKEVWKTVQKRLVDLGNQAKRLWDYTNPFLNMLASSSLKDSFTASATRTAQKGKRAVQVLRIAAAHRIASDSTDKDRKLPGSVFHIKVGKVEAKVDFQAGGTLADLAVLLQRAAKDVVRSAVTWDTGSTGVLVLEGLQMGEGNDLQFRGDLATCFAIGLLKKSEAFAYEHPFQDRGAFLRYDGAPGYPDVFGLKDGILMLGPKTRLESRAGKTLSATDGLTLRFEVRFEKLALGAAARTNDFLDPSRLKLGPSDPVKIEDIDIFGSHVIPVDKDGRPKPRVETNTNQALGALDVLALVDRSSGSRAEFKLKAKPLPGQWQLVEVRLDDVPGLKAVEAFAFLNDNAGYTASFRGLKAVSTRSGDVAPKNELAKAQDALLLVDGVRVKRKTNAFSDLIDGVTLTLVAPGNEGTLTIDHDYESIQKWIYEFVETHNQTVQYLNAVTRALSPEEKAKLKKELEGKTDLMKALEDKSKTELDRHMGRLTGDMTVSRLRSQVSVVLMSPYPTRLEKELILLSQLGISTGKPGATWADLKQNKGMLELDTSLLKAMLDKDIRAVQQLFGNDTNGDNVIDTGVAHRLHELLKIYTQPGNSGVIAVRLVTLDRMIKDKGRTRDRYEYSLKQEEEKLRRSFLNSETKIKQYKNNGARLMQQGGGQ